MVQTYSVIQNPPDISHGYVRGNLLKISSPTTLQPARGISKYTAYRLFSFIKMNRNTSDMIHSFFRPSSPFKLWLIVSARIPSAAK